MIDDNFLIRDRTQTVPIRIDHWSNSQDGDFRRCKRKWWYSRGLGLKPKIIADPLHRGLTLHHALEVFHTLPPEERTEAVLIDAFTEYYLRAVESFEFLSYAQRDEKVSELQEWKNTIGIRTIQQIWNTYGQDEDISAVSITELADEIVMPGTDVPYQFRLDAIITTGDPPMIIETKTMKTNRTDKFEVFDQQSPRNLWAISQSLGIDINHVLYNFIVFPGVRSNGRLIRKVVEFSKPAQLASVYDIPAVIEEAKRADLVVYPTFDSSCAYMCQFYDVCIMKKFGADPQPYIDAKYDIADTTAITILDTEEE